MPRLASPRWSGQGRILGRPDIKVGAPAFLKYLADAAQHAPSFCHVAKASGVNYVSLLQDESCHP
jgi:thymidine phosphorylase